ncbi:MAG: alpha-L-rhamnosidase, partial [Myxococcota bacterium]
MEVSRGPVRGNPSKLHYDPIDLAPYLRRGENTLAIHARYYGEPTPWWIPARPSLGLGRRGAVALELSLGEDRWLGTDGAWRSLLSDAWQPLERAGVSPIPKEDVDAARLPAGWPLPGFDDSDWPPAQEIEPRFLGGDARVMSPPSNPYGALRPRPISALEGETRVPRVVRAHIVERAPATEPPPQAALSDERRAPLETLDLGPELPVRIEGDGTFLLLLDFGAIVSGLVAMEVDAPPGVEIELAIRETPDPPGAEGLAPTSEASFRYRTRGFEDLFESFDPMGLRYALLAIRHAVGPVTLRRFEVRERLYPMRPGPEFACSDPTLERIYEVGRRSVAINSHDAYLDCPSREQRGWTGDAVVHQMVHLAANRDWGLARWHAQMAHSPRPDGMLPMAAGSDLELAGVTIPEWPLHWIRSIWNLWRYTGDRELVGGLLAGAEGVLRWFLPYRGAHGLVCHLDQWVLIDWAALHLADTSSCLNAQWARALLEFAEMSEWLGDRGRAAWARGLHGEIRDAFELFWDESRGSYVDHAIDGERQLPMSQHAGATAVWARLVPD